MCSVPPERPGAIYCISHLSRSMLSQLPTDVLIKLLGHCDSPALGAVAITSIGLREVTSEAEIWRALIRRRHQSLVGEMDPYLSLLPSAALREGADSSLKYGRTDSWQQLYAACNREWLSVPQPHQPQLDRSNAFGHYWALVFARRERSPLLSLPVLLRLALMGFGPSYIAGAVVLSGCIVTAGVTHLV